MPELEMIRCIPCGATNRVPVQQPHGQQAVCGRCKAPLSAPGPPLTLTDANFHAQVEQSELPVLVDMWAPWCGPCRSVGPVIEALSAELSGRLRVGKLNVDDNPVTAGRFAIQSIPAMLLFKGGKEVDRMVGAQPKSEILRRIQLAGF